MQSARAALQMPWRMGPAWRWMEALAHSGYVVVSWPCCCQVAGTLVCTCGVQASAFNPSGLGSTYHSLPAFSHDPNQGPHPCATRNILKALDFLTEIRQGCLQQALVLIISCCPLRLLKNSSSCGGLLPSFVCIPLKRWMPIS